MQPFQMRTISKLIMFYCYIDMYLRIHADDFRNCMPPNLNHSYMYTEQYNIIQHDSKMQEYSCVLYGSFYEKWALWIYIHSIQIKSIDLPINERYLFPICDTTYTCTYYTTAIFENTAFGVLPMRGTDVTRIKYQIASFQCKFGTYT